MHCGCVGIICVYALRAKNMVNANNGFFLNTFSSIYHMRRTQSHNSFHERETTGVLRRPSGRVSTNNFRPSNSSVYQCSILSNVLQIFYVELNVLNDVLGSHFQGSYNMLNLGNAKLLSPIFLYACT